MSVVTNTVLSFTASESNDLDNRDVIERINQYFVGIGDMQRFVVPDNTDWYGGAKVLERPTFVAAFNYLDLDGLIAHLKTLPWRYPEHVQLCVCEQEDDDYRLLHLK